MIFAQVLNNQIQNVIDLEDASLLPLFQDGFDSLVQIDTLDPQPGIGWIFDNINWNPPPGIVPLTTVQIYTGIILAAIAFGQQIIIEFAVANVLAGITQAGKTQAMIDYSSNLYTCLSTGSLYAAIDEINIMIADTSDDKVNLYPFITNDILTMYKNQIQAYLGLPLT